MWQLPNIAANLFIDVQKLRLAPEIWLANQMFVGVYIILKLIPASKRWVA